MNARCLVTAHAGCLGTIPNSMANIRSALACEADLIEVDLALTRDGVVVLTHDGILALDDGRRARVGDLEWATIEKLSLPGAGASAGREAGYLRLETVLDLLAGSDRVLNLDLKEIGAMVPAARLLRERNMEMDVVFSGLNQEGIVAARDCLRGFRYLFNADSHLGEGGDGKREIAAVCALASAQAACGINLPWKKISRPLVDFAHRRCLPVLAWTVDDPDDMASLLRFGPYSITTHKPDALAALIRSGIQGE